MAAHQVPEWETRTNPKKSIFNNNFSNPFSNNGSSADHQKSFWSIRKSPFASVADGQATQGTVDKEAGASEVTPAPTPSRWQRKRTRIMIGVLFLVILILIIGLAVGLSKKGLVNLNTFVPRPF